MESVPLLQWLLALGVLWVLGIPLASRLFGGFPHAGSAFALPVAFAGSLLPIYWLGKLDATVGFVGGLLLLTMAAFWANRTGSMPTRREVALPVAVFVVTFGLLVLMRLGDPRIVPAGGEKFLDYSLLKTTLRAERFPPLDPWFAGERVRYYYGGYLLAGLLTELSRVAPRYAYNLLVPTFYATLATGSYGLATAIAARGSVPTRLAGLVSVFLVAMAGTLATPARLLLGVLPTELAREYGHGVLSGLRMPYDQAFTQATDPIAWSYWFGRYVIPGTPDVFPAWTFVNGDLRPHMTGGGLLVLAAAVIFAYYRTPETEHRRRLVLVFGVLPVVGGGLAVVNTWSLPVVVGLLFLGLWFGPADPGTLFEPLSPLDGLGDRSGVVPSTLARAGVRLTASAVGSLAVAVLSGLWVAPYFLFRLAPSDGIGLFPPGSPIGPFLLVHGGFLLLFGLALGRPLRACVAGVTRRRLGASVAVLGAVSMGLWVGGFEPVALLVAVCVPAMVVARTEDRAFWVVLLIAGLGLLGFAELAYARVWPHDPNAPRWNTVYKIYHSVWILWGVGGGVAAATVLDRARTRLSAVDWREATGEALSAGLTVGLVGLVLVSMAVFPAFAGGEKVHLASQGEATLDGLDYVDDAHPEEAEAIAWLDDRSGQPTIVGAPGTTTYTWTNAPSSLTGLPTVAGWVHQKGYRGSAAYDRRVDDVRRMYEADPATRLDLLERYGVDYVYVGPNERERYDLAAVGTHQRVEPAYRAGSVTVYEVTA
jgi:YYY domain-containing protein